MDIRNCKNCGRLFNYFGKTMCTDCLRKLDDDFEYKLPNENVIKDILEEIHLGKDIDSSWTCADLEKIVPGLFAKYNVSMRMQ